MHDYCLPLSSGCARDSQCLLSLFVIQTTQSDQSNCVVFPLEIHCFEVSNAERGSLKEQVVWASRATSGAACFCKVLKVVVDQVGTWQSAFGWISVCGDFRERELSVNSFFFSFFVTCAIPRVVRTCHISVGSRLRALGCEQNQSYWHLGVMLCNSAFFFQRVIPCAQQRVTPRLPDWRALLPAWWRKV